MPNKTIYIRESDKELWEKAENLAGGSLSGLLADALRRYVEEEEMRKDTDMETITLEIGREERARTVEFVGRWLLDPDPDDTRTGEPGYDAGAFYGVALTKRGNIAVVSEHCNGAWGPYLKTYADFEEAERDNVPSDILAMASAEMGADYVQKLDI